MDILRRIVEERHADALQSAREWPLSRFERSAPAPLRSFAALAAAAGTEAGSSARPLLIAECKRASPSRGLIAARYEPVALASAYERGGAGMISVLTEPRHFLGELSHLRAIREVVAIPLLRKDFIVHPWQVAEAWAAGADAILLIAAAMEASRLQELRTCAAEYGLSVLLEVHSETEIEAALACTPDALGVNTRNLHDFSVDRERARALLGRIPAWLPAVAESGLKTPEEAAALASAGFGAFLVGETFVTAPDPEAAVRSFALAIGSAYRVRGHEASEHGAVPLQVESKGPPALAVAAPPAGSLVGTGTAGSGVAVCPSPSRSNPDAAPYPRPRVKICGITSLHDARLALDAGASILGFIFAPSPRRIEEENAATILSELRTSRSLAGIETVAVFVNESLDRMAAILARTGIDIAQIHGDESTEACAALPFPWYRVLRIPAGTEPVPDASPVALTGGGPAEGPAQSAAAAAPAPDAESALHEAIRALKCRRILFDTGSKGLYGGSGRLMDRDRAQRAITTARAVGKEVFVAGGIGAETVGPVLAALDPDGIDVGSGVEESPGKKSAAKLEALFRVCAEAGCCGRRE